MDVVAAIRSALAESLGAAVCELWFDSGVEFGHDRQRLLVTAPNAYLLDRFRRRARVELERVTREVLGDEFAIDYCVGAMRAGIKGDVAAEEADPTTTEGRTDARAAGKATTKRSRESRRSKKSTCIDRSHSSGRSDSGGAREAASAAQAVIAPPQLVVGSSNEMAFAAMRMVLQCLGQRSPFFIYGPAGAGKSALLESLLYRARKELRQRAIMLSSEQFTVSFLEALNGAGLPSFRRRYRDVKVLLLDDVQFLSGKTATRNELLHTLDALHRQGCQCVITADRAPAELSGLGQELASRFSAGLVVSVDHPDLPMRSEILRRIAPPGLLTDETVELIAGKIHGDARLLSGAVNRLLVVSQVLERSPRAEEVEASLGDFFRSTQRRLRLPDILEAAGSVLGVDVGDIQSGQRSTLSAHPRMLVMFLARKHTQAPLKEISTFFRKRSHSTVLSACGEVERWLQENRALPVHGGGKALVADVIRRIEARLHRA